MNETEPTTKTADGPKLLYWYCISMVGNTIDGTRADGSAYWGFVGNKIPMSALIRAKEQLGFDKNSVITGVSYLGYMTKEEFDNETE